MKPRYRPGKPATQGREVRGSLSGSKILCQSEMQHIAKPKPVGALSPKAGKKGKRASWDIGYEQGIVASKHGMPCREPESLSVDGVRRFPKRSRK